MIFCQRSKSAKIIFYIFINIYIICVVPTCCSTNKTISSSTEQTLVFSKLPIPKILIYLLLDSRFLTKSYINILYSFLLYEFLTSNKIVTRSINLSNSVYIYIYIYFFFCVYIYDAIFILVVWISYLDKIVRRSINLSNGYISSIKDVSRSKI